MTPPIRMVSVPVEPTEDAYTLAARVAPDLFSDDYETAHRAASPYDVTIKRRHKAEEVQTVIDLYHAMLTAAPVRAEDEGRLFAEVPLGTAALYRDLENGTRPILTTREEAPAEAGVSQDDLAELERVIGTEYYAGSDRLGEALARILKHLRAQPPAREDAQPYGWIYEKQDFGPGWCAGLEWYPAKFTRTPPKPETSRNVIALYTHPASDALREDSQAWGMLADLVSWFTKPVQGQNGMVWVIPAGDQGADDAVAAALAALQAEQKGGA